MQPQHCPSQHERQWLRMPPVFSAQPQTVVVRLIISTQCKQQKGPSKSAQLCGCCMCMHQARRLGLLAPKPKQTRIPVGQTKQTRLVYSTWQGATTMCLASHPQAIGSSKECGPPTWHEGVDIHGSAVFETLAMNDCTILCVQDPEQQKQNNATEVAHRGTTSPQNSCNNTRLQTTAVAASACRIARQYPIPNTHPETHAQTGE